MPLTFTGPGGSDPVERILRFAADSVVTVGDALTAGQVARTRILVRISEAVDVNGVAFAAYSPKYGKAKVKAGRFGSVDLLGLKGAPHMLQLIGVSSGMTITMNGDIPALMSNTQPANEVTLGFNVNAASKAMWNNEGTKKMPARRFWDLNQSDLDMMALAIQTRRGLRMGK